MLIHIRNAQLHVGSTAILDHADLSIDAGERVCLLGRNGEGKSTLLRVVSGEVTLEDGQIIRDSALRIAELPQDVPTARDGSVFDLVAEGLGEVGDVLAEYHHLLRESPDDIDRMGHLQHRIETLDGWTADQRVHAVISRLELDPDASFASLSGGVKRRALLARALAGEPDLLLLDEPTNHLDIDRIIELESFLLGWDGALLFVTHDRAFLRRIATRIVELDRGVLTSWPGDYDNFLRRKEEALHAEELERQRFDKKLAQEEVWIRQGIQARRTRNQGRVRALEAMREDASKRREQTGTARIDMSEAERSGKLVAEVDNAQFAWPDGKPLVRGLSTMILRGDRIGIIGPNGAGKTTLLKLLLGEIEPQSGRVRLGTRLETVYFDQLRGALDEDATVAECIGDGKDFVDIGDRRVHVMTYLQDYLFTPQRARTPVRVLSGGERSRLLLARLFTKPCNMLVLDEPTNDLDIETLDLLEEKLQEFSGTLLLVSHDRDFIDRVVTRSLVFEGNGRIADVVGGYSDWARERAAGVASAPAKTKPAKSSGKAASRAPASGGGSSLSSKEMRELDRLPGKIEQLEAEQATLAAQLSDPAQHRKAPDEMAAVQQRLAALAEELAGVYARWEALEDKRG